jgi:hypothetical protein
MTDSKKNIIMLENASDAENNCPASCLNIDIPRQDLAAEAIHSKDVYPDRQWQKRADETCQLQFKIIKQSVTKNTS